MNARLNLDSTDQGMSNTTTEFISQLRQYLRVEVCICCGH